SSSNGTPRTAIYRIPAPGGSWDSADNGTFSVALQSSQVADTSGNTALSATLRTFNVNIPDTTRPTAAMGSVSAPTSGSTFDFSVTYSDNVAINVATLDGNDIRVTGPNSYNQAASF